MNTRRANPAPACPGTVRIISGRWRGTRLPVPDRPGLRPTSDRVRETLFNWLMPVLPGARVLDLFAGTGVLGLEAVSRGARHASLVEADPTLAQGLAEAVRRLHAQEQVTVHRSDALAFLRQDVGDGYDIAFVDPPFSAGLWDAAIAALPAVMAAQSWLYVECPAGHAPALPAEWELHRENRTRDVRYALYRRVTLGTS